MSYDITARRPAMTPEDRRQWAEYTMSQWRAEQGVFERRAQAPEPSAPARPGVGDRISIRIPGSSIPVPVEITGTRGTKLTARPLIAQPCALPGYRPGAVILLPADILQRPGAFRIRSAARSLIVNKALGK